MDICADGFDIKLLKGDAPNVYAHSILQIGSIEGIKSLCKRHNLEVQETLSVGTMDVDILYEHSKKMKLDNPLKAFEYIFSKKEVREDIQEVLLKHFLTGYSTYIIKKIPKVEV